MALVLLLVLVLVAFLLVRRWFRRTVANVGDAAKLTDGLWAPVARMSLEPNEEYEPNEAMRVAWQALTAARFRRISDFYGAGCDEVRIAVHRDQPIAAVLSEQDEGCLLTLFAVDEHKRVFALGFEEETPLRAEHLIWEFAGDADVAAGLSRMQAMLEQAALRELNPRQMQRVWEQINAFRAERALQFPPRRGQIEARAAEQGMSEDAVETAVDMLRSHWLEQVAEAALYRFRKRHPIDSVAWEEMVDTVQVVHEQLTLEEVGELLVETDGDAPSSCTGPRNPMGRLPTAWSWRETGAMPGSRSLPRG
ncbi:MAG: hypothetical protein AAGE01_07055 [Pseudomonadota bacterium]